MIAELLIIGLATWRLSSLLVNEDGPYSVFWRLRRKVGVAPGELTEIARLFTCVWCMSIWVAPAMWLAWEITWLIPLVIAASSVAILVERFARP